MFSQLTKTKLLCTLVGISLIHSACSKEAKFRGDQNAYPKPPPRGQASEDAKQENNTNESPESFAENKDTPNSPSNQNNPEDSPSNLEREKLATFESTTTLLNKQKNTISLEFENQRAEVNFTMARTTESQSHEFRQNTRPTITENFSQGHDGNFFEESFVMSSWSKLDVLLVIDNSSSMSEEQNNLANKLSKILEAVQQSDWKIAITTTDPKDTILRDVIGKGENNIPKRFESAIKAGTAGIGYEQGIKRSFDALKANWKSKAWRRSDAKLAILIVSDEDNCQDGRYCDKNFFSPEPLLKYLNTDLKLNFGKDVRAYGLIKHPSMMDSECSTAYAKAYIYAELIQKTMGTWGSICSTDYSETLSKISKDMAKMFKRSFEFKHLPSPNRQTKIFIDGVEITTGFRVEGQKLYIENEEISGENILVQYTYGAVEKFSQIKLSKDLDSETLKVDILDAQGQVENLDYFFDVNTQNLIFASAPSDKSLIKVKYKHKEGLNKKFKIPSDLRNIISVQCFAAQAQSSCKIESDEVVFEEAPKDDDVVKISYEFLGAPNLNYEVKLPVDAKELKLVRLKDQKEIAFSLKESWIHIDAKDFSQGDVLALSFIAPTLMEKTITLPIGTILASISMEGNPIECSTQSAETSGKKEITVKCTLDTRKELILSFDSILSQKDMLDIPSFIPISQIKNIEITVDGVNWIDYELLEDKIQLYGLDVKHEQAKMRITYNDHVK